MASAVVNKPSSIGRLASTVDAEFREMPGMRLTRAQAQRLWNMSADECRRVFDVLVMTGRLEEDESGRYGVRTSNP